MDKDELLVLAQKIKDGHASSNDKVEFMKAISVVLNKVSEILNKGKHK
jgi:hypothetical protein